MGIIEEDLRYMAETESINWSEFNNRTILITGTTGLLGHLLAKVFIYRNKKYSCNTSLILPVRNIVQAKRSISDILESGNVKLFETEIEKLEQIPYKADYVIHCAAPTQSKFFVSYPIETMDAILFGMQSVLKYAQSNDCTSVVWLSSMEVFGQSEMTIMKENDLGSLSLSKTRSSYPQAKRTAELYAYSYNIEYGIPVKTVRLAQTFGPGVSLKDNRVFMQFCNAIRNKEDIVLQTTGETVSNYCYTADAIIGILKVLLDGKDGETYTLINDDPSITIRDIAEWLVKTYGKDNQKVRFDLSHQEKYAEVNRSKFSNEKIKQIGWNPQFSVKDGYDRLLKYIEESEREFN